MSLTKTPLTAMLYGLLPVPNTGKSQKHLAEMSLEDRSSGPAEGAHVGQSQGTDR